MAAEIIESNGPETALQTRDASRSRLVQRLLGAGASLPQFIEDLLKTQVVVVAGSEAAGFLVERQGQEQELLLRTIAHIRPPDKSSAETRAAALQAFQEIIKPCVVQAKDGAIEIRGGEDSTAEPQFCLVTLLRRDGQVVAATAVITRCFNMERAHQRLVSMQLVAGYFDLYTLRRNSEQAQIVAQSHQHVLQLATAVATAEGFESAAMNLCNELATRTGAARVALGWLKGQDIKVKALSHTEEFDKKQELIEILQDAMEECVDQEEAVHFDPDGEGTANVSRAAQALSRAEGGNIILSLPLRRRAEICGAVTLEFPAGQKLTPQALAGISVAVDLLAPQLFDRFQNDRWLITKAGLSTRDLGAKIVGPQYTLAKVITILVVAALVFICLYKPMYHVDAAFQFDSMDKRKLQAPFDGQIRHVFVQPGDHVRQGQVLLTMDVHEYELQRDQAMAQVRVYNSQYRADLSDPTKLSEAEQDRDKMRASQANADYFQSKIDRGTIKAPFDGVMLKGDLTDQNNATKKEGEELFVIAASNSLRAELAVKESDIQLIKVDPPGQESGMLATSAFPAEKYPFRVSRIIPLGQTKEGDNTFTVYGRLDRTLPSWYPGLGGEARIAIGRKPLVWIWTHKFVDYVRLNLWI